MCGIGRPSRRVVASLFLAGCELAACLPSARLAETQASPHAMAPPAALSSDDACSSGDGRGETALAGCAFHALQLSLPKHAGSSRRERAGIKVIGAGFPRTGTQSLEVALDMLGYHAVHGQHFEASRTMQEAWQDWAKGGPFEPALQTLLDGGFDATTGDLPTGSAWKELHERFPDAKVLLAGHPGGVDRWIDSMEAVATVYRTLAPKAYYKWFSYIKQFSRGSMVNETVDTYKLPYTPAMRDTLRQEYEEGMEDVRQVVPSAQLLEYDVAQGWAPLCAFLGKPVPSAPFPHIDHQTLLRDNAGHA